jgi:hypothetical protein
MRFSSCLSAIARVLSFGWLLLIVLVTSAETEAQRKPVLRPTLREYLAGSMVIVPKDARPASLVLPQLLGRLADHEIILPPASLLQSSATSAQLLEWMESYDYARADGLIVSLGSEHQLTALRHIRRTYSKLPVFALVEKQAKSDDEQNTQLFNAAIELLRDGAMDYLVADANALAGTERSEVLEKLQSAKLTERVIFQSATDEAALLLMTRLLLQRFGFVPQVMPIFSSALETAMASVNEWEIGPQALAAGAEFLLNNTENTRRAEILLFVYTEQTSESEFNVFTESLNTAVRAGYRVALADVNVEKSAREKLLSEIRRRKLFDQLYAYASAGAQTKPGDAMARAISQAVWRLTAVRFLRDDLNRLQRTERAQIELMLTRWMQDAIWPGDVLPKLRAYLRDTLQTDPDKPLKETDKAVEFARTELRVQASAFFTEQFRHNVHTLLLANGDRAEFRLRAIQRILLRFPTDFISEPDIRPGVFIFLENLAPPGAPQSIWELSDEDNLPGQLVDRYYETKWEFFKCEAAAVKLSFRISSDIIGLTNDETFTISSQKKSRDTRHIEISARSLPGALNAMSRLERMGLENQLMANFQVTQSPAFAQRGILEIADTTAWSHRDRVEVMRLLRRLRMNRYYYAPRSDAFCYQRWRELYPESAENRLRQLQRTAEENFIELVYGISPQSGSADSAEGDWQALTAKLNAVAAIGIRHFALLLNPSASSSETFSAQAQFIRHTHDHLTKLSPQITLTVIPTVSGNITEARDYVEKLAAAIPSQISLMLPDELRAAMTGKNLLMKVALPDQGADGLPALQPFQPLTEVKPENIAGIILRPTGSASAALPMLTTAADYVWNSREYSPDASLTQALAVLYDPRSRAGVTAWAEVFRSPEQRKRISALLSGGFSENTNRAAMRKTVMDLREALEKITSSRRGGLLRGELSRTLMRMEIALRDAEK